MGLFRIIRKDIPYSDNWHTVFAVHREPEKDGDFLGSGFTERTEFLIYNYANRAWEWVLARDYKPHEPDL